MGVSATNHGWFWFEVSSSGGLRAILIGSKKCGKNRGTRVVGGIKTAGRIHAGVGGVGIVVGIISLASGLKGSDLRLGLIDGPLPADGASTPEGKSSQDANHHHHTH